MVVNLEMEDFFAEDSEELVDIEELETSSEEGLEDLEEFEEPVEEEVVAPTIEEGIDEEEFEDTPKEVVNTVERYSSTELSYPCFVLDGSEVFPKHIISGLTKMIQSKILLRFTSPLTVIFHLSVV